MLGSKPGVSPGTPVHAAITTLTAVPAWPLPRVDRLECCVVCTLNADPTHRPTPGGQRWTWTDPCRGGTDRASSNSTRTALGRDTDVGCPLGGLLNEQALGLPRSTRGGVRSLQRDGDAERHHTQRSDAE